MTQNNFGFEEVEADEFEMEAIRLYEEGHPDYQPYISHEDLKRELLK